SPAPAWDSGSAASLMREQRLRWHTRKSNPARKTEPSRRKEGPSNPNPRPGFRLLYGEEVTEIFAYAAVRVDPEIGRAGDMDTAVNLLRFANGAIGTIGNCRQAAYGCDQRVEVL